MAIRKDTAINDIQADFEVLSNLVLEQLDLLENIITSHKVEVTEKTMKSVLANEKAIDKKEVKLSEKIVNTIVLHQPVASDLRRIMASYRIIISLERISDLVINITDFVDSIKSPEIYIKLQEVLNNMTVQSIKMVRNSLLSFLNDDRDLAIWTLKNEMVFDEINAKLLKKLMSNADGDETKKHLLMSIISIKEMMSDIERIADHATNIAEAAIYSLEGKEIRHHKIDE